jgi:aprataxin
MMSPEAKKTKSSDARAAARNQLFFFGRDGLGEYIRNPTSFGLARVPYYDDDFVAINDLYPKSSVHALLLPRSSSKNLLHPFEAFEDVDFLAQVQEEAKKLRSFVAKQLRRTYGQYSAQDQARERALNGEDDVPGGEDLPRGRDWEKDVMVGIHAHPSMTHLHVHVLSVDRFSECMKKTKHYNSFATPFFVPLEDFPLAKDDVRRHPGKEGYLNSDLKCWRCGQNFGRSFAKLKHHLKEEFEKWKAE